MQQNARITEHVHVDLFPVELKHFIRQQVFNLFQLVLNTYFIRLAPVLKQFFINVPYHILVASLTLMALF